MDFINVMNLLCLALIVKDSEDTIKETLLQALPFVDYYVIVDTGSSDNTLSIIKETCKGYPGIIEERSFSQEGFFNFRDARNYTLDIVEQRSGSEWCLFIDDSYLLNGGKNLRTILMELPKNTNGLTMLLKTKEPEGYDSTVYITCRLTRISRKLRYRYRIHEIIDSEGEPFPRISDPGIFLFDKITKKMDARSRERYSTDLKVLLIEHSENPKDPRILFYLGQTYGMLKDFKKSVYFYEQRIKESEYPPRYNGYSDIEPKDEELFISLCNLGSIYEYSFPDIPDWNIAMKYYLQAFSYAPYRAEPLFQIALHYYLASENNIAYTFLQRAIQLKIPQNEILFLERCIYEVKIPHLMCCVSFRLGLKDIAKKAGLQCLDKDPGNTEVKTILSQLEQTSSPDLSPTIIQTSQKIIVINAGYNFDLWSPEDINTKGLGGSETSAVLMGVAFVKLGYRVILFSNFIKETLFEGLECKEIEGYYPFLKSNYITFLIVSRFSNFLHYSDNVEKVFLWIHDCTIPAETLNINPNKFGKIICVSNWQRDTFCTEFNFPKNYTYVTTNCIQLERFSQKVPKEKNRFIFSSTPTRGLDHLLDMWGDIIARFPDSKLHLFCDFTHYTMKRPENAPIVQKCLAFIRKYSDTVFSHGRVSQQELAIEFLKSEYFFYPSEFWETFCITALEAQAARTFCIATTLAALPETIGDRGILLDGEPGTPEYKKHALQNLFYIMESPEMRNKILDRAEAWAKTKSYSEVAKQWETDLFKSPAEQLSKSPAEQLSKKVIQGYVINLDRRPDRLESFGRRLINAFNLGSEINVTRFPAIDWNEINEIPSIFQGNDFKSNKAVIGCALSHIELYRKLVADPVNEFYLIFEDDAAFVDSFEKKFNEYYGKDSNFDLFYIGGSINLSRSGVWVPTKKEIFENKETMTTVAYIITKKCAKVLLDTIENTGIQKAIDWFLINQFEKLKVFACNLVYQNDSTDSDIRSSPGYNEIWK